MGGGYFTLSKKELETKVVEMKFDNSDFDQNVEKSIKTIDKLEDKLEFKDAGKNFKNIEDAASKVDISSLGAAFENVGGKISAMSVMGISAISNLTNRAVDAAVDIAKSLSVDQISAGYNKYESKTSSVQTLVNAGYELDEVNEVLDHLMWYSDETSYSFSDMTQALATAASQGLEIQDMIPVIEGMANATSFAGKGAAEFSRVIFNLMQSFGTGSLQLIDWKSVNLAGVSSERLKESLIEAAEAMGTIEKGAVTTGNFEDTLKNGWATTEVMMKAFSGWAEFTEEVYNNLDNYDSTSDAMEALSGTTSDYAESAMKAAQSAKSFTDAIEATKDAVSTGWLTTFDIIFGNINEATALWTDLTNALWDIFAAGGEIRNELLQNWKNLGGRDELIDAFWTVWDVGLEISNMLTKALNAVFPLPSAKRLVYLTEQLKTVVEGLFKQVHRSAGTISDIFKGFISIIKLGLNVISSAMKIVFERFDEFGPRIRKILRPIRNAMNSVSEFIATFLSLQGPYRILKALISIFDSLWKIVSSFGNLIFRVFVNPLLSLFKITKPGFTQIENGIRTVENVLYSISSAIDSVANVISYGFGIAIDFVEGFYKASKNDFFKVSYLIKANFTLIGNILDEFTDKHMKPVKDAVISFKNNVTDSFKNGMETVKNFFTEPKEAIDGFVAGMEASDTLAWTLYRTFGTLYSKLTGVYYSLKDTTETASDASESFSFLGFWNEKVVGVFNKITETFTKFGESCKELWEKVKPYLEPIWNALKEFFTQIGDQLKSGNFDIITRIIELIIGGSIVKALNDFVDSFGEVTERLGGVFKQLEAQLRVKSFKQISQSLLMLAAAVAILAFIPVDKLKNAMDGIAEIAFTLAGVIYLLSKPIETDADSVAHTAALNTNAAKTLVTLSMSLILIAFAMKKISDIDSDKIEDAQTTVILVMAMMTAVVKILNKDSSVLEKGQKLVDHTASTFIALAASLYISSLAIKTLASIEDMDKAEKAVSLIGIVLLEMVTSMKTLKNVDNAIKNAISMVILSETFLIITASLAALGFVVSKLGLQTLWESIGLLGTVLLIMVATLLSLSKYSVDNVLKGAFAALITASSFLPIVTSLSLLSAAIKVLGMTDLWKSIGLLGTVLLIMVASLLAMSKYSVSNIMKGAAAVLIMSASFMPIIASLTLLSVAIKKIGMLEMIEAIGALGLVMLTMSASLIAVSKFGGGKVAEGASAMLIMATAMIPIATALSALALVPFKALMGAVLAMALAFTIIFSVALLASKTGLGASLIIISKGFLVLAASTAVLALGLNLFVSALLGLITVIVGFAALDITIIAGAVAAIIAVFYEFIKSLKPIGSAWLDFLAEMFVLAADKLVPSIVKFIKSLVTLIVDWFIIELPLLTSAIVTSAISIIYGLKALIPPLFELLGVLFENLLIFVVTHGHELTGAIVLLIADLLVSLAEHAETWGPALSDIFWALLLAVYETMDRWLTYIDENIGSWLDKIWNIISTILDFILDHAADLVFVGITIMLKFLDALWSKIPDIIQTGVNMILSLLDGINSAIENNKDDFIKAINDFIYNLIDVVVSAFESWPELFKRIGERILKGDPKKPGSGLIPGIKNTFPKLVEALKGLWEKTKDLIKGLPEWFKDAGKVIVESIKNGLTSKMDELGSAITGLGNKIKAGWEDLWDINSPSKVMEKDSEYLIDGAVKGVEKNSGKLENSFEDLGDSTLAKMNKILEGVNSSLDDNLEYTPTITPVVDLTNVQNGADEINGLMSKGYQTNVDTSKISSRTGYLASSIDANKIGSLNFTPVGGSENVSNITNNFTINGGGDPNVVADKVSKILQKQVDRRNATWA